MEKLVFSLKLEELPIKITDKDEVEKTYTLKELTSDQRSTFLNQTGKKVKVSQSGNKVQQITDHKFLQENLLTKCVYDEEDNIITREVLSTWPAKTISGLFKAAQELSGLDEDGEEEAKND